MNGHFYPVIHDAQTRDQPGSTITLHGDDRAAIDRVKAMLMKESPCA